MTDIQRLSTSDPDFDSRLDGLLAWESVSDDRVQQIVAEIIREVRARGDAALLDYTARFDRWTPATPADLELPRARLEQAWNTIPAEQRQALEAAAERIRAYAEHQKLAGWSYRDPDGTLLGQQVTPLDRAGLYVPGGKAAYPSSVLMNAIPAKVAGVAELIMVVPTPDGELNELVLAAAHVAGVDRAFAVGGAQAVAALAYGTETIPGVDKIVGPGNIYVATIAMGSSPVQTVRAFMEAEAYNGPSLIIAYSTCIAHGINMTTGLAEQKAAVQSGHFPLYRYNPDLAAEGKNPLKLDSKAPTMAFSEFAMKENRFRTLAKAMPDRAKSLMAQADKKVAAKFDLYQKLADMPPCNGNGKGEEK